MVILDGCASCGKIINPKVAVMDHDRNDSKEFQYFVFGFVILGILSRKPQQQDGEDAGNDDI